MDKDVKKIITVSEQELFFKIMQKHLERFYQLLDHQKLYLSSNYEELAKDLHNLRFPFKAYSIIIQDMKNATKSSFSFDHLMTFIQDENKFKFNYPNPPWLPNEGFFKFVPEIEQFSLIFIKEAILQLKNRFHVKNKDAHKGIAEDISITLSDMEAFCGVLGSMSQGNFKKIQEWMDMGALSWKGGVSKALQDYAWNREQIDKDRDMVNYQKALLDKDKNAILEVTEHKTFAKPNVKMKL